MLTIGTNKGGRRLTSAAVPSKGTPHKPQGRHSAQRQRDDGLGVPVREGLQPRL